MDGAGIDGVQRKDWKVHIKKILITFGTSHLTSPKIKKIFKFKNKIFIVYTNYTQIKYFSHNFQIPLIWEWKDNCFWINKKQTAKIKTIIYENVKINETTEKKSHSNLRPIEQRRLIKMSLPHHQTLSNKQWRTIVRCHFAWTSTIVFCHAIECQTRTSIDTNKILPQRTQRKEVNTFWWCVKNRLASHTKESGRTVPQKSVHKKLDVKNAIKPVVISLT